MKSGLRLVVVALVLAVAAAAALLLGNPSQDPTASPTPGASTTPTTRGRCLELPRSVATPSWFPDDLPMPPGSYVSEVPAASAGLRRVRFAVKGSIRDFVRHALGEWPKQGWTLGRGESEPGEAEDNFLKSKENRYGVFRAQSLYCDAGWTWVLIVLNDPKASTAPPPTPGRT